MDLATVFSIVQTIFTAIQTLDQLKDTFSFSHYEKQLERLLKTVNAVQSVLEDADGRRGALSRQQTYYVEELKDVIYDASDVLDEFVTLVKRKELIESASHKRSRKVKSYLSCFLPLTRNLSKKIREVNRKLDVIASNSSKFLFRVQSKPFKFIKPETSSFVSPSDTIIGRGEDLEKIVGMLLNSDDVNGSSLAIVGMGGLGKTAFAQLVFNDPRVTSAFQLKCWICIADQDQWNMTYILAKILKELHIDNNNDLTSLERMQSQVSKKLGGKKYLLVLDDVWTESYLRWQELEKFLMVGGSGSRIMVTTRSKKTAQNIGGVRVHELQGLSDHESWCLFERMAFRPEQRDNPNADLVKIGKEIVKKCINVPLAIRVVGSLLHGESKPIWVSFQDKELTNIRDNDDTMNNILSLSYHHLDSPLKSCFAYCAIFPKDLEIDKQMLIRLWMAQGYINMEYVGEEYFRILLQRCLFQDVTEDDRGEIKRFKIHDLLHDIAEQASRNEIYRLNSHLINVDKKVRHLTLSNGFCPQGTFTKTYIRTCLQVNQNPSSSDRLLAGNSIVKWTCLRSLDLSYLDGHCLPESIGKLFHLRYLDLTGSFYIKVLPNTITKLVNLQTLILQGCGSLIELPNDIYNLNDLTTLDISGCYKLSHMRSNLGMLTNLHTLGEFVVGGASSYEKHSFEGLEVLRSLNNLKGSLQICITVHKNANYIKEDHGGGAFLISKEHLSKIFIEFEHIERVEWEQSLLEDMQPHVDIKQLSLRGYNGETMPKWPRREDNLMSFYFPNLVFLNISFCQELQLLPSLEKLPRLKELTLWKLPNLEYVVNVNSLDVPNLDEGASLYPCLEQLNISELPKLKGWWQTEVSPSPCFAQLRELYIIDCPMLKSVPICSSLKSVMVINSQQHVVRGNLDQLPHSYKSWLPSDLKSRFMTITDFEKLTNGELGPNPTE